MVFIDDILIYSKNDSDHENNYGWCYRSYGIISSMPNLPNVTSGLIKYHSLDILFLKVESQWIQLK
jgi:hypothetical protein